MFDASQAYLGYDKSGSRRCAGFNAYSGIVMEGPSVDSLSRADDPFNIARESHPDGRREGNCHKSCPNRLGAVGQAREEWYADWTRVLTRFLLGLRAGLAGFRTTP